ncbi:MAG TPA: hypothetical protein VIE39_11695 [Thermoanaerobaculia bacterium]
MRSLRVTLVVLLAVWLLPAPALPQEGKTFEKTGKISAEPIKLGWKSSGCAVERVTPKNYPSGEDIDHARNEDRDDKTWLWWEFYVTNDGGKQCRVQFWIDVMDKGGQVVKSSDRSGSLDHDERDDEFRVSTLVRTLDIVEGSVRLRAEIRQ